MHLPSQRQVYTTQPSTGLYPLSPEILISVGNNHTGANDKTHELLIDGMPLESTYEVTQDDNSFNGWKLLSTAQKILQDFRVKICQRMRAQGQEAVKVVARREKDDSIKIFFRGLMRCGSVWLCPFCMINDAKAKRAALVESLARIARSGTALHMLTLTCQHSRTDSLLDVFKKLFLARRTMRNRSGWKSIMKPIEGEVIIRTTEITHGENGWHVHTHELLATLEPLTESQIEAIYQEWLKASLAAGLQAPSRKAFDCRQSDAGHAAKYVTKYGAAEEVTDAGLKHSRGNLTYIDLLKMAENGNRYAESLIREYATATKGRQKMEFGRGWREPLGCDDPPESDDTEERTASDSDVIVLDYFDDRVWRKILEREARYRVLKAYRRGGVTAGRAEVDRIWFEDG